VVLDDLVIDTNVLVHAQNPGERRFKDSVQFVESLLGCKAQLCVDPGFSAVESANRSLIGGEYLDKLRVGSIGYSALVMLIGAGRVREVPRAADRAANKKILQLVRKKRDRTFLSVAWGTSEKLLVSHDYEDFQEKKRAEIRKSIGVRMADAAGVCALLAEREDEMPCG
jgi:hypothetical protein